MRSILKYFVFASLLVGASHCMAQHQGFFLNEWYPERLRNPSFVETAKPSSEATVEINVNFADTLNKVSQYIFGVFHRKDSKIQTGYPTHR